LVSKRLDVHHGLFSESGLLFPLLQLPLFQLYLSLRLPQTERGTFIRTSWSQAIKFVPQGRLFLLLRLLEEIARTRVCKLT
jgi:hypothetical protein